MDLSQRMAFLTAVASGETEIANKYYSPQFDNFSFSANGRWFLTGEGLKLVEGWILRRAEYPYYLSGEWYHLEQCVCFESESVRDTLMIADQLRCVANLLCGGVENFEVVTEGDLVIENFRIESAEDCHFIIIRAKKPLPTKEWQMNCRKYVI